MSLHIIHRATFTRDAMVVWGSNSGPLTIHLPAKLVPFGVADIGATRCCNKKGRALTCFAYDFSVNEWDPGNVRFCQVCFNKDCTPRARWMPEGGWFTYSELELFTPPGQVEPKRVIEL